MTGITVREMKATDAGSARAWQPLTPPGVAAFAVASLPRVQVVQLIFAALGGLAMAAFLSAAWFPTISEAARNLPESGLIRQGQLEWGGASPVILANSSWLAITVDIQQAGTYRIPSDLQLEFSRDSIRFLSLAGYVDVPYPRRWLLAFNQSEFGSWWKAWQPFLVVGAGLTTAIALMMVWAALSWAYALPSTLVCRFVDHTIPFAAVWKLCCAAQLPGSLLMSFTLILYSFRAVELVQLAFILGAHLVMSWVYIFLAIFFLPESAGRSTRTRNPFG